MNVAAAAASMSQMPIFLFSGFAGSATGATTGSGVVAAATRVSDGRVATGAESRVLRLSTTAETREGPVANLPNGMAVCVAGAGAGPIDDSCETAGGVSCTGIGSGIGSGVGSGVVSGWLSAVGVT